MGYYKVNIAVMSGASKPTSQCKLILDPSAFWITHKLNHVFKLTGTSKSKIQTDSSLAQLRVSWIFEMLYKDGKEKAS